MAAAGRTIADPSPRNRVQRARLGRDSPVEATLPVLGAESISSSVGHHKACGKTERPHATMLKWLGRQLTYNSARSSTPSKGRAVG